MSSDPKKYGRWHEDKKYGEVFFKRAVGEMDEMESTKSVCSVLKTIYKPGMKVLDVGCGAGHYLKGLRERVDANINYTGVDATEYYVNLAREAYQDDALFRVGDIFNLDFEDREFDIVMCNNVVVHLPPPPTGAIIISAFPISSRSSSAAVACPAIIL